MIRFSASVVAVVASLLFGFYLAFLNHLDPHQVGITWNVVDGTVAMQERSGWHITPPWVFVSRIDTRPTRVCITSSGVAVFNCKLVRFEPKAFREFVAVEGWRYWWLANRISFNLGYREEYRGMKDILRGYAFSSKQYPFIVVLRDIDEE
ncbi:MAG: hypothetical protein HY455_01785 [Parcubacteria group bacterium]|nr:hypothetical protein [Parcubacteria group bacterium]